MNELQQLNPQQMEAATFGDGPLLILAGAGSGKTRVLTNRIAWLISEKKVEPWNILAITFTNKAAGEMRERVDAQIGFGADGVWVATFHSTCGRILRRFADMIGYRQNFTIYDGDDQKQVMKQVCKSLKIDTGVYKEKMFLSVISSGKDELLDPVQFAASAAGDPDMVRIARVYTAYQHELRRNNAMDFDDMIMQTVRLFRECPDVLAYYQNRFRYIMVDEYQDTNTAQFHLVSLLAGAHGNLCVVGDDDQSIYSFRGANIQNILSFEEVYPDAKVVRLEQNYRSTPDILEAANAVISHNRGRKKKRLWTENPDGPRISHVVVPNAYEEADFVARDIAKETGLGTFRNSDIAILYRTNAQSRILEEKLLMAGIPYQIIGGINFYARKEIKDLLSYLRAIDNPGDDVSMHRIINVPKRGIGATTITKLDTYAAVNELSFSDALDRSRDIPGIGRGSSRTAEFAKLMQSLRREAGKLSVRGLLDRIIEKTGYVEELKLEGTEDAKDRIRNIDELINKVVSYEENTPEASLSSFLQEVSLIADIDSMDNGDGRVLLMTLHSAKGLEFPAVYMTGMEEGLFPSSMALFGEHPDEGIEEERRLCYVGITRARRRLTLTSARMRMNRGERDYHNVSRFIDEIPQELLDTRELESYSGESSFRQRSGYTGGGRYSRFDGSGGGSRRGYDQDSGFGSGSRRGYDRDSGFDGGSRRGYDRDSGFDGGSRRGFDWDNGFGSEVREEYGQDSGSGSASGGFGLPSDSGNSGSGAKKGRKSLFGTPLQMSKGAPKKAESLNYAVGDLVTHVKFGEGTVKAITDVGRDYQVTVDFEKAGTRKIMAAFAKLEKKK